MQRFISWFVEKNHRVFLKALWWMSPKSFFISELLQNSEKTIHFDAIY